MCIIYDFCLEVNEVLVFLAYCAYSIGARTLYGAIIPLCHMPLWCVCVCVCVRVYVLLMYVN
jgi:hypothetical protein